MKVLLIALTILIFAAGCAGDESVGGRLPVLEFDWEEGAENGILFPVDFGELQRPATVLARIGDDRPISYDEVERMFEQAGLDTYYWEMWKQGDEMMSLGRAQEILASISPAGKGLYVTEDNRERPISNALWIDLFLNALDEIGRGDFIETINIIPFRQENRRLFTNMGIFNISNFTSFAPYFDMEIQIIHREREILAVIGLTDRTPVIRNAMILRTDMLGVTIFSGGVQRNFSYASGVPKLPEDTLIADLRISGSRIIATSTAERVIRGTIESVTGQYIELKEWGALPLCRAFAVYGLIGGEAVFKGPQDLLVGANIADFHISHGRVVAAVITRDISPTYIRVVLGTSGFTGLVHDNVVIRSSGAFTVRGGERTERIEPGAIFTVNRETNADFWGGARFYIAPENPAHRLEIVGLRRNHPDSAYPRYRGILEISPKNGGFTIVNELCLEEYLYAVVPSEMPTGHGLEAAKVQAVTARSFAYHQFYENRFRAFGAHVDDSVISQVYNNIPENEQAITAVRATAGQVLTYDGAVILANYFSTSSGMTANFGEVWAVGNQFPSNSPVYLQAHPQFDMRDFRPGDLSLERYADVFFRNTEIPGFDREFPWFRWQVRMTAEELSRSINAGLASRVSASPAMIYPHIQSIGNLFDIQILRRGQGGNLMEIHISGTEGGVYVKTEFNIRTLLNPGSIPVTRHDGTQVSGLSLLPSAFISMEKETDASGQLVAITFFGGGNGHGVGMSQNGARALIGRGYTYQCVLRHYYPGTVIKTISELRPLP